MFRLSLVFGLAFAAARGGRRQADPRHDREARPGVRRLLADGATIELLAEKKFEWSEGPVWDKANSACCSPTSRKNMIWKWSETAG